MRRRGAVPTLGAALLLVTAAAACSAPAGRGAAPRPRGAADRLPGFTAASTARQREAERAFLAVPLADSVLARVRHLTTRPHFTGTDGAADVAGWLVDYLSSLGFDVEVREYEPYLPFPVHSRVRVTAPEPREVVTWEPDPRETPLRAPDASAGPPAEPLLLAWNGYAGDGAAEAPLVYVNYGLPEDYELLRERGVDVGGRVVLARFGRAYRGVKVWEAQERGAAAVLLYPDPAGDGYAAGDTVPLGPYRPSWSVQRGTVSALWRYTGDPLTPGMAAVSGAPRLDPAEAAILPRIPVVPISYAEAGRLLEGLEGDELPAGWRGALSATYRPGPGPLVVRVESEQIRELRTIRNVIARLPGRTDAQVVVGNHYDAWIRGGIDPHSGTGALLEIARGLSALIAAGWTPERTLTLGFWDAEELGVVGSTEWVEDVVPAGADLVAYLNVDVLTAGALAVAGSPILEDVVVSAAAEVEDPETGRPLLEGWRERPPLRDVAELDVLGAGSDWTAFYHWAGVPSLQWTMNGRGTYAVYHSSLDDFDYAERWGDPGFRAAPAMARVMGLTALRLANADVLPFRYSRAAERISRDLLDLEASARSVFGAAGTEAVAELVDLAGRMEAAAREREARVDAALEAGDLERARREAEPYAWGDRLFLLEDGLPGRPWYRHVLYAPSAETGYASVALPELAAALEDADRARWLVGWEAVLHVLRHSVTTLQAEPQRP